MLKELNEKQEFDYMSNNVNSLLNKLYFNNYNQIQIANKLRVTDRAVRNWENGECLPNLKLYFRLVRLCKEIEALKH